MKKTLAILLTLAMVFALCACGQQAAPAAAPAATEAPAAEEPAAEAPAAEEPAAEETVDLGEPVTIQIGFENTLEEPVGMGVQKWAELIQEKSGGNITVELFPSSALGSKSELIDMMEMGEPVITIADTSFCADYGVPDLGICFGPFFFESWEDAWTLIESDWYKGQLELLAEKGITIVGSNWKYGERELMTKEKVLTPDDLAGMKIRLANSEIYVQGFNALGATAVPMALGDVYTALQNGTLEGVENPLSTLWGQSFQEVCSYILMTGHIKNFSTWLIGTDFFNTLTEAQQEIITSTCEEAGLFNNEKVDELLGDYRAKLEEAGVEITDMTAEEIAVWKEKAASFYELGEKFGWSEGLYETAQAAMGK